MATEQAALIAFAPGCAEDEAMWHVVGLLVAASICSPRGGCGQGVNPAGGCMGHAQLSLPDESMPTITLNKLSEDAGVAVYALNFGPVTVGTMAEADVLVQMVGCSGNLLSQTFPSDAEFGMAHLQMPVYVLGTCEDGGGVSVPVRFEPFSPGPKSDTLSISTDTASAARLVLNLSGTGM